MIFCVYCVRVGDAKISVQIKDLANDLKLSNVKLFENFHDPLRSRLLFFCFEFFHDIFERITSDLKSKQYSKK